MELARAEHLIGRVRSLEAAAEDLRGEASRHDEVGGTEEAERLRRKAISYERRADFKRGKVVGLLDRLAHRH